MKVGSGEKSAQCHYNLPAGKSEVLKDRIRQCAKLAGSGDALSQKAAIPRRTLESYLSGSAEPKAARLAAIAKAVGVSAHWLVTGEGPMLLEREVREPEGTYESRERGDVGIEFSLVRQYDIEAGAGGEKVVQRESEIGKLAFRRDWLRQKGLSPKDLVVIRVMGDSMSPTIRDGALVLVDTSEERPRSDGIYVLSMDGGLVAKRIQIDLAAQGLYIRSDNPAYREQYVDADHIGHLYIVGRVVWAGGEV